MTELFFLCAVEARKSCSVQFNHIAGGIRRLPLEGDVPILINMAMIMPEDLKGHIAPQQNRHYYLQHQ